MSFTLSNVAFSPVRIASVKVQGSHPEDFQLNLDECTRTSIDAGMTCDLQVIFSPTAAGRRTANVVAVTDGGVYATILISGDARYEPKIAASNTTIIPGSRVTLTGIGFAPNVPVTISWGDGSGATLDAMTSGYGTLDVTLVVRPTDRPGNRTLVAQTADGQTAVAEVLVVSRASGVSPGSANWPGR